MTLQIASKVRAMDASVWVLALLALGGAAAYARWSESPAQTVEGLDGGVRISLPAGWTFDEGHGRLVAQRPSLGAFSPTLEVSTVEVPEGGLGADVLDVQLASMERDRAETGFGFRVLDTERRRALGGHDTTWIRWALVRDPPDSLPSDSVIPVVLSGVDVLVITEGGRAYQMAAWDRVEEYDRTDSELGAVLESVRVMP